MTAKQSFRAYKRLLVTAEVQLVKRLLEEAKRQLQILKAENFGNRNMHICSGMGRSFLVTDYGLKDPGFPAYRVDDNGVLDYVEPGNRKLSKLISTKKARAALLQIYYLCDILIEENLTTAFPHKLYA